MKIKPPENISEDCLFLNVWTPSINPSAKLPVIVFIHGGAFLYGKLHVWPHQFSMSSNSILPFFY
jgi:carboxylesterase type B